MGSSEIEEILDSVDQCFKAFKNFDVSYYYPVDHHFINNPPIEQQSLFLFGSRKSKANDKLIQFRKRMEQEWKILKNNLPNSMYVRAYESRIELMRAVIIGLEGTPYAYNLFFFDIFFPKDYPSEPPLIFQHHNHTLLELKNTNSLSYDDGEWLELDSRFMWDPRTSNVLHVLEYIHRYVLRASRLYAKDFKEDFLLSRIAMLSILKSHPKEFEDFVKGYFRNSSHNILLIFRREGKLGESEVRTKLFFELLEAFEQNGSYCKHHAYPVEKETPSLSEQESSANNGSPSPASNPSLLRSFKKHLHRLCNRNQ